MTVLPRYEDFEVHIEEDDRGGFRARILDSPFGRGRAAACDLPYLPDELTRFLEDLETTVVRGVAETTGAVRRDLLPAGKTISSESSIRQTAESIGARLFESLFRGDVDDRLRSSLDRLDSSSTGLRIRIGLDPTRPRLAPWTALPWELLCRPATGSFLSRGIRTPVVRYFDVPRSTSAPPPLSRLSILVVAPRPRGLQFLDHRREADDLLAAWAEDENIEVRRLEPATIRELRLAMSRESIHAFHFIGHGDFDPDTGEGVLFFEDERGDSQPISGRLLAETIETSTSRVRMAVLNACESAQLPRREGHNPFGGVASALVMAGVPAVVAHQFRISDDAAVTFSGAFYHALAQGYPVDGAVTEGRLAIVHSRPQTWEWITPVLYMGTPDGSVLDRETSGESESAPPDERLDPLKEARDQLELKNFEMAISILEESLRSDPRNGEAYYLLALAQVAGRRPRSLTFDVIERIERDLETAARLAEPPARVFYLRALVKLDHYPWNGRTMTSPTADELLAEAAQRDADCEALEMLLDLVPTPDNAVRRAIGDRTAGCR